MTDDFMTMFIRCDRATADAEIDGLRSLRPGTSVTFVLTNVSGVALSTLSLCLYSSTRAELQQITGFAYIPGRTDTVYANASVGSAALNALLATVALGTPTPVRMIAGDGTSVFADVEIDAYPNPVFTTVAPPTPWNPFITDTDFTGIAAIKALPTLTPADREARMVALLNLLDGLAPA
jgi:hypothetical protein